MTDVVLGPDEAGRCSVRGEVAGWTVEVCRNGAELAGLADAWRDLCARSPSATPFQAHAWVMAWWDNYGRRGSLRTVLVRRHGRLVAAAPLMATRRWGLPILVPLGGTQSDYTDVLVDRDQARGAVWHLSRALLNLRGWCAVDFPEVRPGSAVLALAEHWPRTCWHMPASICLELPAGDIGTLLARLPTRKASKVRAKLRRIEASGISVTPVCAEEADAGVGRLLDLHLEQWRGRPVNKEHARPRFRRHLASALAEMIRDGEAALYEYRRDGRLLASDMVLIGRDMVGAYLYGAASDLRDMVDVTLLLLRQDLGVAACAGVPTLSMLRGDEPYKRKWRPDPVGNERLILGRTPAAIPYAATARCRAALRQRHFSSKASDG